MSEKNFLCTGFDGVAIEDLVALSSSLSLATAAHRFFSRSAASVRRMSSPGGSTCVGSCSADVLLDALDSEEEDRLLDEDPDEPADEALCEFSGKEVPLEDSGPEESEESEASEESSCLALTHAAFLPFSPFVFVAAPFLVAARLGLAVLPKGITLSSLPSVFVVCFHSVVSDNGNEQHCLMMSQVGLAVVVSNLRMYR